MRVEIGGGPSPMRPNWEQFDANDWSSRTGLQYVLGDIRDLPYPDKSVESIFASNVLEHVSFLDTHKTLVEWLRVLQPDGTLEIVVPDLIGIVRDYFSGKNSWVDFVERVYGSQTYDLDLHRAGFTLESMPSILTSAGFCVIECKSSHDGGGVTAIATPR